MFHEVECCIYTYIHTHVYIGSLGSLCLHVSRRANQTPHVSVIRTTQGVKSIPLFNQSCFPPCPFLCRRSIYECSNNCWFFLLGVSSVYTTTLEYSTDLSFLICSGVLCFLVGFPPWPQRRATWLVTLGLQHLTSSPPSLLWSSWSKALLRSTCRCESSFGEGPVSVGSVF